VRLSVGICVALTACLVGACSGTGTGDGSAPALRADLAGSRAGPAATPTPSPGAPGAATPPATPDASLTDAALRLQSLLGQHAILASDMMRARIRADSDLAQAANAALGKNTQAMGTLLGPVIGPAAVQQFAVRWGDHIEALFNYSRGLATDDEKVQRDSRTELEGHEAELAEFVAGASKGRLDRADAVAGVHAHADHLLDGADAYAAGRQEVAADAYRRAYSHAFELGDTFARALLPAEVGKELDTPAVQLRATLTQVLGEHVALVIATMRSGAAGRDDVAAMGDAVNENTVELTAAIDSLFGTEAAKGFQTRWADHVDGLMEYTEAAGGGDRAGQEQARRHLREFEQTLASFLNTATQNRLGQPALTQALVMHDRTLLAEIDAYAAKNFQEAHDLSYQTYDNMFTVSKNLSAAIGATLGNRLPRGGSQTGGGAMAESLSRAAEGR
jgi:hypothetical protein